MEDNTYKYLLEEFGKEKLENRFLFLYALAERFVNDRKINELVSIDTNALYRIVIDYFADIARLKTFHGIDRVNDIKIAAYTSYWVYKRKPIYITRKLQKDEVIQKPYLDDINEWFCAFIIISILYNMGEPLEHGIGSYIRFSNFINLFVYNLSYRTVTAQSIELALCGVETMPGYARLNCESSE